MTLARFENLKINLTLRAEGEKKDINNLVRSFKKNASVNNVWTLVFEEILNVQLKVNIYPEVLFTFFISISIYPV